MTRALLVNPWMPQYRLPFFSDLRQNLMESGIQLTIAHGLPDPELARRGDTKSLPGAVPLRTREIGFGHRRLSSWGLPDLDEVDLLIVEQGIRHVALYQAIVRRPPWCSLALWGHGRTYTKPVTRVEEWWKQVVTRRADWFFAYTEGGRRYVAEHGFPSDRVTVVQNSQSMPMGVSPDAPREPQVGLFVGGLDASKRIDLLLESADVIKERLPAFRLVVAGRGAQQHLVEEAALKHDWIQYVGFADETVKAELARQASVMLVPGRVGLIVVDCMVHGLPLVTTDYGYHAPELEYLTENETVVVTSEEATAYADGVVRLLEDHTRWQHMSASLLHMAPRFTLDAMVNNFADGVRSAIERGRR